MPISKYPREGQRIAPLALREVLAVPVPNGIFPQAEGRFGNLSDLDESVWRQASSSTCRVLANYVVHEVHRNLNRIPFEVRALQLSAISSTIPLPSLELEVRTNNCIKKRFGWNVPSATSIRDLLNVPCFGARCLVDFLVALEAFSCRPERSEQLELESIKGASKEPILASDLPSEFRVEISRFPRKGQRIAPRTLAQILDAQAKDRRMGGVKLRDLDESAWERFESKTCHKLALEVINRVKQFRDILHTQLGETRLPMPRTKGKPAVLQLQRRTFNCLNDIGLLEAPARLAETTFGALFALPGFGEKCLVDLLCALETQAAPDHPTSQRALVAAHRLSKLRESANIRYDDPRFGLMIQSLAVPGENLKQVAEEIVRSTTCTSLPRVFEQRLENLLLEARASKQLRLEDELGELLSFEPRPRNRELAVAYLGWDGKGAHTLEEVGLQYGVTRARVGQIVQRLVETLKAKRPFLPVLDRTLQAIAEEIPCPVERLESTLAERNLCRAPFRLDVVISAAEITGRSCPFIIEDADGMPFALPRDQEGIVKIVLQLTRKSISHWGAATIEDIAAQVSESLHRKISAEFVKTVLSTQPGFSWLDEPSGWFWLKSITRNPLLNQIQKVISVAPRIHVSELRAGVSRPHRREGFAPPQRVLIALCAQAEGYAVEGSSVLANTPLDYREVLSDTESIIVDVLHEHGPVIQRPKLEQLCLGKGLHRDAFYIHLSYSPVVARYAPGVYGLRGAQIPPGLAESMVESRRKTRVLADYGWLPDGRIIISYKLSKGTLANGIVSIPAGMKPYLQGEFGLLISDGQSAGRLVVKDSQAWGLGPFFRRRGGESGDLFQIVFDMRQMVASVSLREDGDNEGAE
jgi:hypothetical protein